MCYVCVHGRTAPATCPPTRAGRMQVVDVHLYSHQTGTVLQVQCTFASDDTMAIATAQASTPTCKRALVATTTTSGDE